MTEPNPPPERFELTLRDVGGVSPVANRLRNALKQLLRVHGFRCEVIKKVSTNEGVEHDSD